MRYYWSTNPDLLFDTAMKGRLTECQANGKDKTWTVSPWKWLFSFVPAAETETGLGVQLHKAMYQKGIHACHGGFFRFPLLAVQLNVTGKIKCFLRNHLRRTALFEENEMTAKVVSENQPDAGLVSEADLH